MNDRGRRRGLARSKGATPGDVTRAESFDVIELDIGELFSVDTAREP